MPGPEGLLILWHSVTGANRQLAQAAYRAACDAAAIPVRMLPACLVGTDEFARADGFLFVLPEMLGGLPGPVKTMFDDNFYPLLGRIEGRPYALIVGTGSDGAGAVRQIERIANGWRLRRVLEPVIVRNGAQSPAAIAAPKTVEADSLRSAAETGSALAHALAMGIW